jgi:hypothetical protein
VSLDIRFSSYKGVVCPHCGEIIGRQEVDSVGSGGRGWYPILEELGYYVPYEQRTEESDWYGKDMVLTTEQAGKVYRFIRKNPDLYDGSAVKNMIASALLDSATIVVNADW